MTFSARSIKTLFGRPKLTTSILKSLDCNPCKLTGSHRCDLITSLILANETALLKHSNKTNFKAYLKKSIKLQENERQILQLFTNQLITLDQYNTCIAGKNSCIEWLNFAIQNRCDKVVIELRLLQLWIEIVMILVIWNQTCAARSSDLKSSVWFQTKLLFTQFNNHYFYI